LVTHVLRVVIFRSVLLACSITLAVNGLSRADVPQRNHSLTRWLKERRWA